MGQQRTAIRRFLVSALKGPETEPATMAGSKVYDAMFLPIQGDESVPCLIVYTSDEPSKPTGDAQYLERTCTVTIEGAVVASEDEINEVLDQLTDQVEAVIDADPRLAGLVMHDLILKNTTSSGITQGQHVMAWFRMDYDAVYQSRRTVDEYPTITAPTKVWSDPHTDPQPYEDILGINPLPKSNVETACGPDGCQLPFYQGELQR